MADLIQKYRLPGIIDKSGLESVGTEKDRKSTPTLLIFVHLHGFWIPSVQVERKISPHALERPTPSQCLVSHHKSIASVKVFLELFGRVRDAEKRVYNEKREAFASLFLVGAEGVEPPTLCL